MANRVRAVVAAYWSLTVGKNGQPFYDQEIANLVTARAGDSFSDITGQLRPDKLAANVYLCEADVRPATMTEIAALPGVVVMAQETYDDVTEVVSSSNFDSAPSAAQLTAFGTQLKARFPGIDDERLKRSGQPILRSGLTRRQIIAQFKQNFKELEPVALVDPRTVIRS